MLGRDITTVIYYSKPYLMKKQINLFSIYLIKYNSKTIWAKTVQKATKLTITIKMNKNAKKVFSN
jgi:hypothetical protein